MIKRYSSRREPVDQSFLNIKLQGARSYDRIAGYFSSSIVEVAGEALDSITGKARIICNSELDILDVETAKAAALAIGHEWRANTEDKLSPAAKRRLARLYDFFKSGKLEVRVLPNKVHGLLHGKAGVITFADGTKTSFLGSINESKSAWQLNYELMWEDDTPETVEWVQEEFDELWNHPKAQPLANAVIEDVKRLSEREVVSITKWKELEDPASPVIETPVYQKEYGLWAHQKYFVKKAFDEHRSGRGARFVLADQVGLGKTLELALSAMLMALHGDKPILVIAPKTLIWQWQEENMKLLNFPAAVWDGKCWVDENEIKHVNSDPEKAIINCPRKMGIISQGIITHGGPLAEKLLQRDYECVIVDEVHRARRRNLKVGGENEAPEPNNLMSFLWKISGKTKSMLLATATPVQLYPIEAYDLLDILARGSDHVLGDHFSQWRRQPKTRVLDLIQGFELQPREFLDRWDWIKNPFPPATEHRVFEKVRRALKKNPTDNILTEDELNGMKPWEINDLKELDNFFQNHNPFIRTIIRRTRKFLEEEIDPETGNPFLKKVEVKLFGENDEDAIHLPGYLSAAYEKAEEFCKSLAEIMKSAGFIKTLLLRRMGSSVEAGKQTALKFLGNEYDENDDEEDEPQMENKGVSRRIGEKERKILGQLIAQLEQNKEKDPKYAKLHDLLFRDDWASLGCIIFSQYFATVEYFSQQLAIDNPTQKIGVYAGGAKSGYWLNKNFQRCSKEELKKWVQNGEMKIIFGTDSASEGLNLQRLGTLINLDLPWNPTRLEQRKGRIQRIGQIRDEVFVYNMRYKDSVEDRVHDLLSSRLEHIFTLFGQIPDILEDVWVEVAMGNKTEALRIINEIPQRNPFEIRYDKIHPVDFESCSMVLNKDEVRDYLVKGWNS